MNSVMTHQFSQVPAARIPRSIFDRSHGYKTTFDASYLIPVFMDEALPGDTYMVKMSAFARLATPIVPIMDNLFLDSFFFAVPIRLIWTNWEKFNGEQTNPGDSTSYVVPTMAAPAGTGHVVGSLSDYLGIPTGIATLSHSSLWHRAYNLIWNEWFRDENLQNSVTVDTGDGPDTSTNYALLKRGKRHDYFTSCLPWPQKRSAGVSLPLGTEAPIKGKLAAGTVNNAIFVKNADSGGAEGFLRFKDSAAVSGIEAEMNAAVVATQTVKLQQSGDAGMTGYNYADLTNATAATIDQLLEAFALQQLYVRDARGGTRYTEIVRSHFGVVSPDARLQRPEYLGGGSSPIHIHPIAQTSSTDGTSPQGNLAAMGTVSASGHGFSKSFTEHCILLGLVNVRADLNYQQGLHRMFSRSTRFDFYWPALANMGEQSVLNKEIYAQNTADDALVFGYQERYAEYRYKPSLITGQFRSTYASTLDIWHLAQEFSALPTLNSTFIQDSAADTVDRVIATPTSPQFLFDSYFKMKCARPMPTYSVPGLVTRF